MFDVAGATKVVIEKQIFMSSQCVNGPGITEVSLSYSKFSGQQNDGKCF